MTAPLMRLRGHCLGIAVPLLMAAGCGGDDEPELHPPPSNPELELYSVPGTPHPGAIDDVRAACEAMLTRDSELCGTQLGDMAVDDCVDEWRAADPRGCGAAYEKFLECRTNRKECEETDEDDCGLYTDAAFLCATEFVQRTSCAPVHVADVCDADVPYVYVCGVDRKPFPECAGADVNDPVFCCF